MIPNNIWTYWHDPSKIPLIVQKCIETWKSMNPSYTITILDDKGLLRLTGVDVLKLNITAPPQTLIQRRSDFVRLIIVQKFGGIWMDSTMICLKSLDWVTTQSTFVGYWTPSSNTVIENWFFAAPANDSFVTDWLEEAKYMLTFKSEREYVDSIKGLDYSKVDPLPYLVMHLCNLVVTSRKSYKLSIESSVENGPFTYLSKNEWECDKAVKYLCESENKTMLVKLRRNERIYLEQNPDLINCVFASMELFTNPEEHNYLLVAIVLCCLLLASLLLFRRC